MKWKFQKVEAFVNETKEIKEDRLETNQKPLL